MNFMQTTLAQIGGGPWWQQALLSRQGLLFAGVTLASLALLLVLIVGMARLGRRERKARPSVAANQDGTAMLEFALVFPIALFVTLLLAQTTLLMGGNLVVHYAAYAATRTAMVQVPADYSAGGEPPNVVNAGTGNTKQDRIHKAAVVALLPVAGRMSGGDPAADAFVQALTSFYTAYGQSTPSWVTNGLIAQRYRYADVNTTIEILTAEVIGGSVQIQTISGSHTFGPKDALGVRLKHDLNLSIPYVRGLYSDKTNQTIDGAGMATTITAQYLLSNEGISRDLPPPTPVPRVP